MLRRGYQASRRAGQSRDGIVNNGNPLFYAQQYGLLLWLRADVGITLGGTLRAAGTVPPVVSISGSTSQQLGLYIQIDGAGTLGVATFKWSIDNGATFVATGVLTGASVVLGTTGITAAFAAGSYLTNNIYRGTVSAWADQSGALNHVTQATANVQPAFSVVQTIGGITGRSAVVFDVGSYLAKAATNLFGAGAYSILAAVRFDTAGNGTALGNTNTAATGGPYLGGIATNRRVTHIGQFDASDGAIQTTAFEVVSVARAAGAAPTMRVNAVNQSLSGAGAGLTDPGGTAAIHIGAGPTGLAPMASRYCEIQMWGSALPNAVADALARGMLVF